MFINNDLETYKNLEQQILETLTNYTQNTRKFLNDEEGKIKSIHKNRKPVKQINKPKHNGNIPKVAIQALHKLRARKPHNPQLHKNPSKPKPSRKSRKILRRATQAKHKRQIPTKNKPSLPKKENLFKKTRPKPNRISPKKLGRRRNMARTRTDL